MLFKTPTLEPLCTEDRKRRGGNSFELVGMQRPKNNIQSIRVPSCCLGGEEPGIVLRSSIRVAGNKRLKPGLLQRINQRFYMSQLPPRFKVAGRTQNFTSQNET